MNIMPGNTVIIADVDHSAINGLRRKWGSTRFEVIETKKFACCKDGVCCVIRSKCGTTMQLHSMWLTVVQ